MAERGCSGLLIDQIIAEETAAKNLSIQTGIAEADCLKMLEEETTRVILAAFTDDCWEAAQWVPVPGRRRSLPRTGNALKTVVSRLKSLNIDAPGSSIEQLRISVRRHLDPCGVGIASGEAEVASWQARFAGTSACIHREPAVEFGPAIQRLLAAPEVCPAC